MHVSGKATLALTLSSALLIVACDNGNNNTTNDGADNNTGSGNEQPPNTQPRFQTVTASDANGGGEILVDTQAKLSWINDTSLDTRGDGCVSPGQVGPIEPTAARDFCNTQQFSGFTDWRAPTADELSTLIREAGKASVTLKYLNPSCPAVVASDGFVRTENSGNPAVAQVFPNASAGEILEDNNTPITTIAGMSGVPAGLRCVRDGVEPTPTPNTSARFESRDVDDNPGGETLIDNKTRLEWVNDTQLDANGQGCISPANVGPTEPSAADTRCKNQSYANHNDWRAPTTAELTELTTSAINEGQPLKYLNPLCPALVGTDGIIRTENKNANADAAFPNAQPGDRLGDDLSTLPGGVGAGLRCVRDL